MNTKGVAKKVEVPFSITILAALSLHLLAGVALRYYPIGFVATPASAATPEAPVTMRFVQVPPNSPIVAERPPTRNISDANRRADPFRSKSPSMGKPAPGNSPGRIIQPRRPTPQVASSSAPAAPALAPELPATEKSTSAGDFSDQLKSLNASLQNLDKYVALGSAGGGSGGNGEEGGDIEGKPGGSGVLFDTEGHDLGPWGNKVVEIVRSNWIVPIAAQLGTRGITGISFEVDRAGNITALNVVTASGVPSFDQAALNALKSSNPLPPLPPEYPRPVLNAIFRFYINTPVPQN